MDFYLDGIIKVKLIGLLGIVMEIIKKMQVNYYGFDFEWLDDGVVQLNEKSRSIQIL